MLGEIVGLQLIHVADMALRIVLEHHRGRNGHAQRGSLGNGRRRSGRGAGGGRLEIAEDLDCGRLFEFATLDGFLGESESEDHGVALLRGRKVGDRGGNRGFAFDGLAGGAAGGENKGRSGNGKEKMENGRRHS
jgi:hypothetical protein